MGPRVVYFANLPLRLVMPKITKNITEVVFKTIPSATKIEIRRLLEKLYGLDIRDVHTINYDGKLKRSGTNLYRTPAFKKAYVVLNEPVNLPDGLVLPPPRRSGPGAKYQQKAEAGKTSGGESARGN